MSILPRFARAVGRTSLDRARRGPLVPSWSFAFEATVAFLRDTSRVARGRPPLEQRAIWSELRSPPNPVMRRIRRTESDGVRGEWFVPSDGAGDGVVLFFHGGSFIYGSMTSHGEMIARLALAASARVLALDYRLAPESPFPAALDDATAAYRWLLGQGIPPSRIVLAGDSAGGNLAVATLLSLRDHGTPLPAGAIPICPWVDPARTGGSLDANVTYDWGFPDDFRLWASTYAGPTPLTYPLVSPARADLSGLPPLHVLWGSREMLRDQVADFCARATAAGVDVHADEYPDMIHNWITLHAMTPEAERAYQAMGRFVRRVTR